MKRNSAIRLILRLAILLPLAAALALFAFPWWAPTALPPLLRGAGVELDAVKRIGGRLVLEGLRIETGGATIEIDAFGIPYPQTYLVDRLDGRWSEASSLRIGPATVRLAQAPAAPGNESQPDLAGSFHRLNAAVARWHRVLPPVRLAYLEIRDATGDRVASVGPAQLTGLRAAGTATTDRLPERIRWTLAADPAGPWELGLSAPAAGLGASVRLETSEGLLRADLLVRSGEDRLSGEARFPAGGLLPARASVRTQRFRLNPEWVPAPERMRIERLSAGPLEFSWKEGTWEGTLRLDARLAAPGEEAVPFSADLAFDGDRDRLRVRKLDLFSDWAQLSLDRPVTFGLPGWAADNEAELHFGVDLDGQPFFDAGGLVQGTAAFTPSPRGAADLRFGIEGSDLRFGKRRAAALSVTGGLRGSRLSIERGRILADADGEDVLELSGSADLDARSLDLAWSLAVSETWVRKELDGDWLGGVLRAGGTAGGSFDRPVVEGTVGPTVLETAATEAVTVEGRFRSEGTERLELAGTARCAGASIEFESALARADGGGTLFLERLVWVDPERPDLVLEAPVEIGVSGDRALPLPERLRIAPFRLDGKDLEVAGRFDDTGGLELEMRNVSLVRLNRWLKRDLPAYRVEEAEVTVTAFRPWLEGRLSARLEEALGPARQLRLELDGRFSADGFAFDTVALAFQGATVVEGAVRAPVRLRLPERAGKRPWELAESGPLEGSLAGRTSGPFSDWLESRYGVLLEDAAVRLDLGGTVASPRAELEMNLSRLALRRGPGSPDLPPAGPVELKARIEPDLTRVERFACRIEEGLVEAEAEAPTAALLAYLSGRETDPAALLAKSRAELRFSDWKAENWKRILPAAMRQTGRVEGRLELRPGLDFSGELAFDGFALRPTRSLPAVDRIGGRLTLADRILRIEEAGASVGGSPVTVGGQVELTDLERPLWDISITGENVPLVRTTEMILRSDLDLRAVHGDPAETPLLLGGLDLRSSVLLLEFDPLAAEVETGPARRPPFFSIAEEPFADWRFDLEARGDAFMRVRSPYFRTRLSAAFDLKGTFAEPLLTGSLRTVGGELQFPGAKLRLDSGEAFIEPGRPDEVQLEFSGTARTPAHVVTMDVTGTLAQPQVHFQSTPDLPNARIVRLLATGSTAGGGVGSFGLYLGRGLLGAGGMRESVADNVAVNVGSGTTRSGRNTVDIRYTLSEEWFLNGEYDVYDAYNLDLVWSLFRR